MTTDRIEGFLQRNQGERVTCNSRWLVWDSEDNWVVREHIYGKHKTSVLYRGPDLAAAIQVLEATS